MPIYFYLILLLVVGLTVLGLTVFLLVRNRRLGIVVVLLLVGTLITAFVMHKPAYKVRTERFAAAIKSVADPAELQKWAMATITEAEESGIITNYSAEIPASKIPKSVQSTQEWGESEFAFIDEGTGAGSNRTVYVVWGGGSGHWGIRIGSTSFRVDPNDRHYYIEWTPGVYFFDE